MFLLNNLFDVLHELSLRTFSEKRTSGLVRMEVRVVKDLGF